MHDNISLSDTRSETSHQSPACPFPLDFVNEMGFRMLSKIAVTLNTLTRIPLVIAHVYVFHDALNALTYINDSYALYKRGIDPSRELITLALLTAAIFISTRMRVWQRIEIGMCYSLAFSVFLAIPAAILTLILATTAPAYGLSVFACLAGACLALLVPRRDI